MARRGAPPRTLVAGRWASGSRAGSRDGVGGAVDVVGPARVDRRTKRLIPRLHPGDVAVIDHEDLDRVAAEGLVQARPAAVVNAAASMSGRYPTSGPIVVVEAGIPLVDGLGYQIMDLVADGQVVRVEGGDLWLDGAVVGKGRRQTLADLTTRYEEAKRAMGVELERFAENTLEYLRREREFVTEPLGAPELRVDFRGRHALIVVRGSNYREDLAHLRSYVREIRPVIVGVYGGADALLEFGLRPDLIVGDFDSVSTAALQTGAQLVVHAYRDGRAPGATRLDDLGLPYVVLVAPGTSEDVAMLLAEEKGAELLVAVGTHTSMVEFLDKGRRGMASTFLVRMKLGDRIVDANGVNKLYESRIRKRDLMLFLAVAMLCFLVIALVLAPRVYLQSVWLILRNQWRGLTH